MLKIIFVIIGTLIGAGFASGREIYLFFTQYGKNGIIGITLTGFFTSVIIYKVLIIMKIHEINNYNNLLEKLNWKHEKINKCINFIINAFLLISFYIMVAGFSGYIKQTLSIPTYVSSGILCIICYLIFKKNIGGVVKVNEALVPILIVLILYFGFKNIPYLLNFENIEAVTSKSNYWFISCLLYASYNSIILIPVLTSLRDYITSKKQIIKISILSGTTIIILALTIYQLLLKDIFIASKLDMPIAQISLKFGYGFKYIYGFVIITSIFTSAISTGYSFLKNVTKSKDGYNLMLLFICTTAVLVANIGFSKLVEILYPLFGVLGLIQIFLLLRKIS